MILIVQDYTKEHL